MTESKTTTLLAAAAAGGAAFSFLASPMLIYADPSFELLSGLFLMTGLIFLTRIDPNESVWWSRSGYALVSIGAVAWATTLAFASLSNTAARAACMQLQRDMLSAHPTRTNAPEVFTAMGCKPQTDNAQPRAQSTAAGNAKPRVP